MRILSLGVIFIFGISKSRQCCGLMYKESASQPRDRVFEPYTDHDHVSYMKPVLVGSSVI